MVRFDLPFVLLLHRRSLLSLPCQAVPALPPRFWAAILLGYHAVAPPRHGLWRPRAIRLRVFSLHVIPAATLFDTSAFPTALPYVPTIGGSSSSFSQPSAPFHLLHRTYRLHKVFNPLTSSSEAAPSRSNSACPHILLFAPRSIEADLSSLLFRSVPEPRPLSGASTPEPLPVRLFFLPVFPCPFSHRLLI